MSLTKLCYFKPCWPIPFPYKMYKSTSFSDSTSDSEVSLKIYPHAAMLSRRWGNAHDLDPTMYWFILIVAEPSILFYSLFISGYDDKIITFYAIYYHWTVYPGFFIVWTWIIAMQLIKLADSECHLVFSYTILSGPYSILVAQYPAFCDELVYDKTWGLEALKTKYQICKCSAWRIIFDTSDHN